MNNENRIQETGNNVTLPAAPQEDERIEFDFEILEQSFSFGEPRR